MQKYLVTIEFRYKSKRVYEFGSRDNIQVNKTITIGVFEDFDTACIEGNKALRVLENNFKLNVYFDGRVASGAEHSFKKQNTLVTNMGYLKTPFQFYAKIETLDFKSMEDSLKDLLNDLK